MGWQISHAFLIITNYIALCFTRPAYSSEHLIAKRGNREKKLPIFSFLYENEIINRKGCLTVKEGNDTIFCV